MAHEFGVTPPEGPLTASYSEVEAALADLGWTEEQIRLEMGKLGPRGGYVNAHPDLLYAISELQTAKEPAQPDEPLLAPFEDTQEASHSGLFMRLAGRTVKAATVVAILGAGGSGIHGVFTREGNYFNRFFGGVINGIATATSVFDRDAKKALPNTVSNSTKTTSSSTPSTARPQPSAVPSASPTTIPTQPPAAVPAPEANCETRLANAPTESLVALTIMVPIEGDGSGHDKKTSAADVRRIVGKYGLGGVILMTAPTPETTAFLQRQNNGVSLVVGIDQEGGTVRRIKTGAGANFPSAAEMATKSDAEVTTIVRAVAKQLKQSGITTDFAPVLDLAPADGTDSKIGKTRVFGGDPVQAARLAKLYAEAMLAEGIVPVYKHFGGGSMDNNTDLSPAQVPGLEALNARDLVPYTLVPKTPQTGLMIGTFIPKDGATNGTPANQSALFYDLAKQYGFTGFMTTDDIGTKAAGGNLAKDFIDALQAGATMPLYVQDQANGTLESQVRAILAEGTKRVTTGVLTKAQLAQKIAANATSLHTDVCTIADVLKQ